MQQVFALVQDWALQCFTILNIYIHTVHMYTDMFGLSSIRIRYGNLYKPAEGLGGVGEGGPKLTDLLAGIGSLWLFWLWISFVHILAQIGPGCCDVGALWQPFGEGYLLLLATGQWLSVFLLKCIVRAGTKRPSSTVHSCVTLPDVEPSALDAAVQKARLLYNVIDVGPLQSLTTRTHNHIHNIYNVFIYLLYYVFIYFYMLHMLLNVERERERDGDRGRERDI